MEQLKKVAKYLVARKSVVLVYELQDESKWSYAVSDSDWGGNMRDCKSTSGERGI